MIPRAHLLLLGLFLLALLTASPALAEESEDDGTAQAKDDEDDGEKPRVKKDKLTPKLNPRSTLEPAPRRAPSPARRSDPADDDSDDDDAPPPPPPQDDGDEEDEEEGEPWSGDEDTPAAAAESEDASAARRTIDPLPTEVKINIDYDDVEIKAIIKDFAHKTGRNFLVDGAISGKITIHAPRAVSVDEAYEAFIIALDSAGYTTVVEARFRSGPNKGKPMLTRILGTDAAKSEPLDMYKHGRGMPQTAHLVTRLVQLENTSADEMSRVVQKWVSKDGDMVVYAPSNTLIITDSANNIRRIMELINELDISAPQQKLEVITIEFAQAQQVLTVIQEIYGTDAASTAKTPTPSRASSRRTSRRNKDGKKTGGAAATAASSTSVGEQSSFIGKMIADERTNSIIVLATEKSLVEIKELIARIDYEVDPFAQADIHVIYLEYAKAEELSSTLNSLVQQSNSRTTQRTTGSTARTSGRAGRDAPAAPARGQTSGQPGNLGGNFSGEVRVTHDVPTNSLVVTASRDDYSRLKRVVQLLDIPRKQVFVETVIMEVSDTRINDSGVSWHGGGGGETNGGLPISILGARGSSSISPATSLLDGSLLAGLGLGIFGEAINIPIAGVEGGLDIPAFGVVLRFLQEDSATNVLSSPNILTLDNEEATIEIGETVPFPTGGMLGGLAGAAGGAAGLGGYPSISFTREDVGIILRITPQINESDWVTLDIYQEISEVKEGSTTDTLSTGGPTTTKRSAETHVSVQSNQTVVIGGLMQEVETESESKIPILGDIPLLGALFRNKRKTKRKTNLLIFLTPHVISGPEDLHEIYTVKMLQREEFMRRFYGKTPDQQMDELNALIRYSMNLPGQPSVYSDRGTAGRQDVSIEGGADPVTDDELRDILDELDTEGEVLITPEGEVDMDERGDEYDEYDESDEEYDDGGEPDDLPPEEDDGGGDPPEEPE
jgi:general secretion pathway protein D